MDAVEQLVARASSPGPDIAIVSVRKRAEKSTWSDRPAQLFPPLDRQNGNVPAVHSLLESKMRSHHPWNSQRSVEQQIYVRCRCRCRNNSAELIGEELPCRDRMWEWHGDETTDFLLTWLVNWTLVLHADNQSWNLNENCSMLGFRSLITTVLQCCNNTHCLENQFYCFYYLKKLLICVIKDISAQVTRHQPDNWRSLTASSRVAYLWWAKLETMSSVSAETLVA